MRKIVIIGGGPAGYVAAITAARQDQEVILIEERELGGTCLNEGCMPTKSLLESADLFEKMKHTSTFGVKLPVDQIEIDWPQVQLFKNGIVDQLVQGIHYLMRKNKIIVKKGSASFLTDSCVKVVTEGKEEMIEADRIIIATGSKPAALPFADFDHKWIIHSRQALMFTSIPSTLFIVGGGVIGCEFASIYSRLGTKVTIVEAADHLLPGEDKDIALTLEAKLKEDGVHVYTSAAVKELIQPEQKVIFTYQGENHEQIVDYVLLSVGRKPRVENLGLAEIGLHFNEKGMMVNEQMQTNISHIYACGDVIGGQQLAHVAFHEGKVAALHACGIQARVNYHAVPRCIYSTPEIASVGLTETQARKQYGDQILIGECSFNTNGRAFILGEPVGKVKVIVEKTYQEIVGMTIVGPRATELIGQGTLMLHSELTLDSLEQWITAHPTLSEVIQEALLQATGQAIHI